MISSDFSPAEDNLSGTCVVTPYSIHYNLVYSPPPGAFSKTVSLSNAAVKHLPRDQNGNLLIPGYSEYNCYLVGLADEADKAYMQLKIATENVSIVMNGGSTQFGELFHFNFVLPNSFANY